MQPPGACVDSPPGGGGCWKRPHFMSWSVRCAPGIQRLGFAAAFVFEEWRPAGGGRLAAGQLDSWEAYREVRRLGANPVDRAAAPGFAEFVGAGSGQAGGRRRGLNGRDLRGIDAGAGDQRRPAV